MALFFQMKNSAIASGGKLQAQAYTSKLLPTLNFHNLVGIAILKN